MREKPKIAVIGLKGLPAFGGAARSMESIINYLKQDFEITVYSINTHTSLSGDYNGVKQIVFKGIKNKTLNTFIYYWKSLFHVLFCNHYDLIHMNHAESGFIIPFLKLKYKVLTTLHGVYTEERFEDKFSKLENKLFKLFQWFTFIFSDKLVSVSKFEIPFCEKKTSTPIEFIPNGINRSYYISDKQLPIDNYLLFAASRIYGLKGLDIMLDALIKIDYKDLIVIIGDMSHDEKYAVKIKKQALKLNVMFINVIRDQSLLFKYIQAAKLFIFPSRLEAMSNMLLEVASIKCPIICSNIPANTDIFNDQEVFFFQTEDTDDLSKKIIWVINNYEIVKVKATRAYNKLMREYTWESISDKYKRNYNKLIRLK